MGHILNDYIHDLRRSGEMGFPFPDTHLRLPRHHGTEPFYSPEHLMGVVGLREVPIAADKAPRLFLVEANPAVAARAPSYRAHC